MMRVFFLIISFLCFFSMKAQSSQKEKAEQFISSVLLSQESEYSNLLPLLKITRIIPEEEGGIQKIYQVFSLIKLQIQDHSYQLVSSQEAYKIMEQWNENRASDILSSDKGTVFYVYLPEFNKFLVRSLIVVNEKNEIIAIFIGFCKGENHICLDYL